MKLGGICVTTNNAPRLAEFYRVAFQIEPVVEGSHYDFGGFAVWDPGDVVLADVKNIWLQCFDADVDACFNRLLRELPGVEIISAPERKPWGAYSFWFADPDGNKIAVAQSEASEP